MDRRSFFRVASAIGALFGLPAAAMAQPRPPGGPPGGPGGPGRGGGMLDRMAGELKLTPDQKSKIQAIFNDQRTKMEKLRAETDTKVKKVLTPAQQKQYADMQARMRRGFGGGGFGGPGGPGGRRP